MLVILVLLIVDICKKKKDEEVVEGFVDDNTDNLLISFSSISMLIFVISLFCLIEDKNWNWDDLYPFWICIGLFGCLVLYNLDVR